LFAAVPTDLVLYASASSASAIERKIERKNNESALASKKEMS
jgi:hypothetical protein